MDSTTRLALLAAALTLLLGGCASAGALPGSNGLERRTAGVGRVEACRRGDTEVANESRCLQDDAACYPLASGAYCTGPRGNVCPAGSTALAAGQSCPPGGRCFALGESLVCLAGT